jgi:hypothetical protein
MSNNEIIGAVCVGALILMLYMLITQDGLDR